jgi:muramoyltetrapeptide carboxypeptidase LdcA involved in peptidoglycan recycling
MRPELSVPSKLSPGDRVAVVSPSFAAPGEFPELHDQAMRRLRQDFDLVPVEYPTTRRLGAPARDRAEDLMAAYADRSIRAVLATIGGDDQITVLPHLDPKPFIADPKPFFGYSDNTNLLNWLWHHGVASYHGGSTMVHLGRGGGLQPVSADSLRAALFRTGDLEIHPVERFSEQEISWRSAEALTSSMPMEPSPGWVWHQPDRVVTAPTWGGNLEIVGWLLMADRSVPAQDEIDGHVLILETSEEIPRAEEVFRTLRNMGERGLLGRFAALLMGRAKAWERNHQTTMDERAAVLAAMAAYNPDATIVFDVDFGHTDPQLIIPYGGLVRIDGPSRMISVRY